MKIIIVVIFKIIQLLITKFDPTDFRLTLLNRVEGAKHRTTLQIQFLILFSQFVRIVRLRLDDSKVLGISTSFSQVSIKIFASVSIFES